jgi:electron transfer flavoprotein-quinone oxidoreductase
MSDENFDAIVVGAGPAGCACAYALARAEKSVLLLERGETAGSKNVSGGRLYTYAMELLEPGLYQRAPLQRKVVREQIMLLGKTNATTIDYVDYGFGAEVPQSFTVLRAPLDEWFASEAEAKGAMFAAGILVEDLIEEEGKIVGIKAGEDEMRADVVIAADGVNSRIGQKAGLFPDISARAVGVGVKEVIELPESVIDSRFNVSHDEGAARVAIGCTEGISGGAFMYTNKESISLGIVFNPEQAAKHGKRIQEIFQDFKMHPAILPLIEGGTTVEYGAHLVPELGLSGVPEKLYRDGLVVVGDAAGFGINTGTIIRGMDLAILSGLAAANAVIQAEQPAQVGPLYMEQLNELLLLPNMKVFQNWHEILGIPRIFEQYPDLANEALKFMFTVDGAVPKKMTNAMWQIAKRNVSFGQLVADGWKAYRAI